MRDLADLACFCGPRLAAAALAAKKEVRYLMNGMTAKERVLEALKTLPDDANLEEVLERLTVLLKLQIGLAAVEEGRTVSQEEARDRMSRWLK